MKPERAPSLASRLTRTLVLTIGCIWLLMILGSTWQAHYEISESMDSALDKTAHRLLDLSQQELDAVFRWSSSPEVTERMLHGDEDHLVYQIVNRNNQVMFRSGNAPKDALSHSLRTGFADVGAWRVYTILDSNRGTIIHVADALKHRHEAWLETAAWLLLPWLLALPLLALLIRWITRRHLQPLQDIAQQIQQRGGQDLSAVQAHSNTRELQTIAASTNQLLGRLASAIDTERALATNAAHELRTPLASALVRLHTLLAMPIDDRARTEAHEAHKSLVRLNRRAEKLMQLSRAESSAAASQSPVNLCRMAQLVVQEFSKDADASRIHLHIPQAQDVVALGDLDTLAIALRNLLENALRHAGSSAIDVVIEAPATMRVRDGGPGVPVESLQSIRLQHVRVSANVAGHGLGLSIISTIVEKQGGELVLYSPPAGQTQGFEACIRLREAPSLQVSSP